jgi:hypothetical protein
MTTISAFEREKNGEEGEVLGSVTVKDALSRINELISIKQIIEENIDNKGFSFVPREVIDTLEERNLLGF